MDPRSGFCAATLTFHSLRHPVPLPPPSQPLSVTSYVFSSLSSASPRQDAAFTNATTSRAGASLSYTELLSQVPALASSLRSRLGLAKGDVAFVLSPPGLEIPVLYFALLSIGVVVSPSNPASTPHEISYQIRLTNPVVAFATSAEAHKLPRGVATVLLDDPHFRSLIADGESGAPPEAEEEVRQSDPAAVLYSSGTTGRVKAVVLSHRNLIALTAYYKIRMPRETETSPVALFTVPVFHVFGFGMLLRMTALGETSVLTERFDFAGMLRAVESGQGYGLTEAGGVAATIGPEESRVYGSAGRLAPNMEGKIVDPSTGRALPPGQQGELWLRGPTIMLGYLGDPEATAATLDSDGWLKTGDLCYINEDGFLFIVGRLKELIKYKGYQVPPAELERLLLSHPEIADAAVVPYPDEEAGQIPLALIVRRHGSSLRGDQVIGFVAKHVAPYKKVRCVSFIDSIPKSAAGKIIRSELMNHAISGSASRL